jgi:hypothetical protein
MPLSPEDITALIEALKPTITEVASKAAADHVTKRNKSFEDKFVPLIESIKPPSPQAEEEPEKATLTQRMAKQEEDNRKLREELRMEKEANLRKNMRMALESDFAKRNLTPYQIKALAAQMIHEDKVVDIDKQGNPVFKVAGYNNETVPLQEGLDDYFKNDGKHWIPEPKARGTNQRTIKSLSSTSEPEVTQEEADTALMDAIRRSR